jgi:hypothetical protein
MSSLVAKCFIFAGPSLFGITTSGPFDSAHIKWCPPVRRGDIELLITTEPPQTIAILDGVFQQSLAVGHAEIRIAIESGWIVWGLSSMGAIRAYEMRDLGMKGFGRVYERFLKGEDFRDDEVALLHAPEAPYQPFSEPLVHIRVALEDLVAKRLLTPADFQEVISRLESMWFGYRTLTLVEHLVRSSVLPDQSPAVSSWLSDFARFRIKSRDLEDFLNCRLLIDSV